MFNGQFIGDIVIEVLEDLFRLPPNGKPITVMQLAGFPAEVVDSVVSVLCRMAFDFGVWSDGVSPILVACEEVHRYAPQIGDSAFVPLARLCRELPKEGRKYGVFLAAITQRPAERDATILSQCSTVFAMRRANDRDQAIVKAAVADAGCVNLNSCLRWERAKPSHSAKGWHCRRAFASRTWPPNSSHAASRDAKIRLVHRQKWTAL